MKQLAANDRHTRDKAVESLRSFLSHRTSLSQLELLKLWKGLFYCMWMSDKPRTQQELARQLAGLVEVLPDDAFLGFMEAFWETMKREWMGIDVLRMDKFLYLVRQYLRAGWEYWARRSWERKELLVSYLDLLAKIPLSPKDMKVPDGMRYHVIDIYVDELEKADEKKEGKMPVELLLRPLQAISRESATKKVRERAKEALNDERLASWNGDDTGLRQNSVSAVTENDDADEEDEEWEGIDD